MTTGIYDRFLDFLGGCIDFLFLGIPRILNPLRQKRDISREEYERQIDYYITQGYVDNPESFFTFPNQPPVHAIINSKPYHDGECQLIRYQSNYVPRNPHIRERYDSYVNNRTGYLVRWTHGDKPRKTVLCHHGYMLGEPRQARKMFRVKNLYMKGLDVVLFVAPFHWKRGVGTLAQRGIYLQPNDVVMTCEAVGQTIYDLYGSFLILQKLRAPEIGLIGASLGGHNAALLAGLTPIASFTAIMVPAVRFTNPVDPDSARLAFPVDGPLREKIWRVWELHSPLNFSPTVPPEKLLVVASRGDLLCPFNYIQLLCEKWEIKNRHFLTGGHWLIFNRSERGNAWYTFLRDRGFLDPKP